MNIDDFKKEMAKAKENPVSLEKKENTNDSNAREKAMKAYLEDVGPISEYINEGFDKIDAKRLTKKEGNSSGR